jgi:hypothetical protein
MADLSPTIRQRELGMRLREFRTAKGLTVEDVAKELLWPLWRAGEGSAPGGFWL